jgi:hypothetical protein
VLQLYYSLLKSIARLEIVGSAAPDAMDFPGIIGGSGIASSTAFTEWRGEQCIELRFTRPGGSVMGICRRECSFVRIGNFALGWSSVAIFIFSAAARWAW